MKAYEASGITKEESSAVTVITTEEVKAEPKKNAKKATPKTMKKSTARTTVKEEKTAADKSEDTVKEKKAVKTGKTIKTEKLVKAEKVAKPEKTVQKTVVEKAVPESSAGAGQTEKDKTDKKARGRKPSIKKEIYIQFYGRQIDEGSLMKKVIIDCENQNVAVKDIRLYLKPEDNTCYYVANGNVAGKVELYESV